MPNEFTVKTHTRLGDQQSTHDATHVILRTKTGRELSIRINDDSTFDINTRFNHVIYNRELEIT